jgi:hypothetical protein
MEKRTPHCKLAVAKAMAAAGKVRVTVSALAGGAALGFGFGAIVGVVAAPHARYRVYLQRRNDHDSGLGFNKHVNASIVDPGFIARVRKKLALDRRPNLLNEVRAGQ